MASTKHINANACFRYIFAQILGAYLTCLIIYVQWKDLLVVRSGLDICQVFRNLTLRKGCRRSFN